jgi:uncharacterized protein GlcG (DUF336 family)
VYFERMDDTQTASMDIAIGKARSAATYRRTTRVFMEAINKGLSEEVLAFTRSRSETYIVQSDSGGALEAGHLRAPNIQR